MGIKEVITVLEFRGNVTSTERHVLIEMSRYIDSRGASLVSQTAIAANTRMRFQSVARVLNELQIKGLVEKLSYGKYRVILPSAEPDPVIPNNIGIRIKAYIKANWPELKDGMTVSILDGDEPELISEALEAGYLKPLKHGDVDSGPVTLYTFTLTPHPA